MTELYFSVQAQAEWELIFNQIEAAIQPGGEFCNARDYASKVAENIARVAGVMHAFEGYEGDEISVETLRSAAQIVRWYAAEFIRLFSPPNPGEIIRMGALELDAWLINYVRETGSLLIRKNDLLQLGPNKLRKKELLDMALHRLAETGRLWSRTDVLGSPGVPTHGRRRGTFMIELNADYYGQLAQGRPLYSYFGPL